MSNSIPRALATVLEIMYCYATFEGGQVGGFSENQSHKTGISSVPQEAHRNSSGRICNFLNSYKPVQELSLTLCGPERHSRNG